MAHTLQAPPPLFLLANTRNLDREPIGPDGYCRHGHTGHNCANFINAGINQII